MTPDAAALAKTLTATGIVADVQSTQLVDDGMQHRVLIVNDAFVARFPRNIDAQNSLDAERRLLTRIAPTISAPLPVPLAIPDLWVHAKLHGQPLTRRALAGLAPAHRGRVIEEVGTFLAQLHQPADDLPHSDADTSLTRLRDLRARVDQHVMPLLWAHQREWIETTFAALDHHWTDAPRVIIHGDLAPYHLLHDPSTGALTGVLDFGVAGLGDPAVDLSCLMATWGEPLARELYRHHTALEAAATRARLLARLLPLQWAAAGIAEGKPDLLVAHLGHLAMDLDEIA